MRLFIGWVNEQVVHQDAQVPMVARRGEDGGFELPITDDENEKLGRFIALSQGDTYEQWLERMEFKRTWRMGSKGGAK